MNKFLHTSILLSFIFLTGCIERQKRIIPTSSIERSNSNPFIREAYRHLGKSYRYGASGPNNFDCSGFVYAVHKNLGISIPRTSRHQSEIKGSKISKNNLIIGDLVFFDTSLNGHINHSGIYLGNGKFIHASSGKAFSVTISDINAWYKDKFRWGKHINANK